MELTSSPVRPVLSQGFWYDLRYNLLYLKLYLKLCKKTLRKPNFLRVFLHNLGTILRYKQF
jgi:hypothetical protein